MNLIVGVSKSECLSILCLATGTAPHFLSLLVTALHPWLHPWGRISILHPAVKSTKHATVSILQLDQVMICDLPFSFSLAQSFDKSPISHLSIRSVFSYHGMKSSPSRSSHLKNGPPRLRFRIVTEI